MENKGKVVKIKYYFNLLSLKSDPDVFFNKSGFKKSFKKFFHTKNFRLKDTDITYRKAYNLTEKLLKQKRESGKWRTFTFKELVFIDIVNDLMDKYSLSYKNLEPLASAFLGKDLQNYSDAAFFDAFLGLKVYIIIGGSEYIDFYNETYFDHCFNNKYNSYILVDLSNFIMNLWEECGEQKRPQISLKEDISISERQLLDIIRNDDFSVINIKKQKGDFIIKTSSLEEVSKEELYNIIKKRDFVDVRVIKRDGAIVKIKVEDFHKIKAEPK